MEICRNFKTLKNGKQIRVWSIADIATAKVQILAMMEAGSSYGDALNKLGIDVRTSYKWRQADNIFDNACQKYTHVRIPVMQKKTKAGVNGLPKKKEFTEEEKAGAKEEFLNGLKLGLPVDYALMLASATRLTLKKWMEEDESFMIETNKAQAQNLAWWIQKIRKGAEGDWRAALAYLERVFPHLFAEVKQVEIVNKWNKGADIIDIEKENKAKERDQIRNTIKSMTDEQLMELALKSEQKQLRASFLKNH